MQTSMKRLPRLVERNSESASFQCQTNKEMLARKGLLGVKGLSIFVYVRSGASQGRDFDDRIAPQTLIKLD
jgi:hypothetical protein